MGWLFSLSLKAENLLKMILRTASCTGGIGAYLKGFLILKQSLFFNMFVFLSGLLNVVKAYHLTLSLSEMDVQPIWTHPDGMAGFSALGRWGCATMVVVLVSGCGLVALIDHKGKQGVLHLISDLALICLSIPALWLLSMPAARLFDSVMIEHNQVDSGINGSSIWTQIESPTVQAEGATVEELSLLTAVLGTASLPSDLEMLIQRCLVSYCLYWCTQIGC